MFENFAVSLAASVTFFILGYSTSRLHKLFVYRSVLALWKPLTKRQEVAVVLTTRPGPMPRSTPRVSLNEVQSYVRLARFLAVARTKCEPFDSQGRLQDLVNRDVIVLGGPLSNAVSAEIWRHVSSRVPVMLDLETQSMTVGTVHFQPVENSEGLLETDYAMVIRSRNILNPDRHMLLCFGCHGWGTLGAAIAVTSEKIAKLIVSQTAAHDEFVAILRLAISNQVVGAVSLERLFFLGHV